MPPPPSPDPTDVVADDASDAARLALLLAGQATIAITAASRHYKEITSRIICAPHRPPRSVIDQAIGILMAHQHCGPDEAFGLVRAMSQRRNIKLREVAANLMTPIQDRA